MPAYLIVLREEPIRDADAYAEYQRRTREMATSHPLIPRVIYGNMTALEGNQPDGVIMLEFPSVAAAEAWYQDPDYQAALPHRLKSSSFRAFIVSGLA